MKTQNASAPPTAAGGPHILVLGQDEEDVTRVRQALDALDAQIDQAVDDAAAWSRLAARPYDLPMLLLPLPETDGLALSRRPPPPDARAGRRHRSGDGPGRHRHGTRRRARAPIK